MRAVSRTKLREAARPPVEPPKLKGGITASSVRPGLPGGAVGIWVGVPHSRKRPHSSSTSANDPAHHPLGDKLPPHGCGVMRGVKAPDKVSEQPLVPIPAAQLVARAGQVPVPPVRPPRGPVHTTQ